MKRLALCQVPLAACALFVSGGFLTADGPVSRDGSVADLNEPAKKSGDPAGMISRPVLGYVAQSRPPGLRAILGVPGAAVLSVPLVLPGGVTRVCLAPGQSYALVERREDVPAVMPLNGVSVGKAVPIPAALQTPDFV